MELTIKQALQQAVAAHKGGSLQEAERIYRAILKSQPKHPDANHNLGVLAVSVNQTESALPFLKAALDINPNVEQFWLSYIDALVKARRLKDAKQAVKKAKKRGFGAKKLQALLSQPQSLNDHKGPSESQLNSLMDHYQNGRFDDAEKLATMLTQEFPSHQFAWKVAGAILGATGRQSEALKANQTAIALHAEDADAHYNLGITLQAMGKLNEAEASYNQAIALKPGYAEAYNNLGNTLIAQGKFGEAEACLTQAIALNPDYAEAINNLGNSLQSQGKFKEAEVSYNQAIALKPGYTEAYNNLGNTLRPLARFSEAEANLRHAIALKPDYIEAHKNLGSTLKALGRIKEAEASFYQEIGRAHV